MNLTTLRHRVSSQQHKGILTQKSSSYIEVFYYTVNYFISPQ